jgi:hypothetical protein
MQLYLAKDINTKQSVALKTPSVNFVSDICDFAITLKGPLDKHASLVVNPGLTFGKKPIVQCVFAKNRTARSEKIFWLRIVIMC